MTDKKHEADLERVSQQNSLTDLTRRVDEMPNAGLFNRLVHSAVEAAVDGTPYEQATHGRTSFENFDLNDMVDMVEQTNPEDLESSGKALWDARDAIQEAARELKGRIDNVHWVGESGEAFRTWGRSLVTSTEKLSEFAGGAGDQITAAAVGLASVRKAMPSKDPHNRKRPGTYSEAEKTTKPEDYADAVRVEKDRQEAINQMNRLSSYYAVSEEQLKVLEPPVFKPMPDVGVPKPSATFREGDPSTAESSRTERAAGVASGHPTVASVAHGGSHTVDGIQAPPEEGARRVPDPDIPGVSVGTTIDSVGTLPPSTTPATGHTPPTTAVPTTGGGGTTNAFGGGYGAPLPNVVTGKGLGGVGGVRTPASAQGRAGMTGTGNASPVRPVVQGPVNQVGRTTTGGQTVAKGVTSGSKSFPMGPGPGVSGGTPRAGGAAAPRTAGGPATGAGRSNGVVGGRPTATGAVPGKSGPRIPRGTVIGAEAAVGSRTSAGQPEQRGVFGGPGSTARPGANPGTTRGGSTPPSAVTGNPATRNSAATAERNGMTRGGTGLVRGPGGGKPGDRRDGERSSRPDHVAEDQETHLPTKPRRDVPPVVN
ncbi:hypothetical protein [Streptomyces sp. NPDC052701]|uniref:WXG100 family type VII secretion target n=1 Tax=Streptomyces sp. NPDC052701 TaxID=3155533 RepID=UPI0034462B4D